MFRKYLFVVAATLAVASFAQAQTKQVEPATAPKEAPKLKLVKIDKDFKLNRALRVQGPCTFVGGQSFPVDMKFGAETVIATCELAGTVKVETLNEIPADTVLLRGSQVTLAPGEQLPVAPPPPAKPKMYLVDGVLYPEQLFDRKYTTEDAFRLKVAKYLLTQNAGNSQRINALEVEVKSIQEKLSPKQQAQALTGSPSGQYCWSTCGDFGSVGGRVVRNEGWDGNRRMYCYQYMN